MTRRLVALHALLLASGACTPDPHALEWGVRFASIDDRGRAAYVEMRIRRGACGTGEEVYAGELDPSGSASLPMPPELESGAYCFEGRARDDECVWFVSGRREVELPLEESMLVVLLDTPMDEAQCPAAECTDGICEGLMPDAGPPRDAGDTDGGGTDAGPDAGPPFDAGQCVGSMRNCDGIAANGCETDITSDDAHCGACNSPCGEASCTGGSCTCGTPLRYDGAGRCVDVTSDPLNCGDLGDPCDPLEYCVASGCECRPGLTSDMMGGCVNLRTDPRNCGGLGVDCSTMGSMTACRDTCEDNCNPTQTDCNRACVDTTDDVMHCGGCNQACAADEVCSASDCRRYRPAIGCGDCPCSDCGGSYPDCLSYGMNVICVEAP